MRVSPVMAAMPGFWRRTLDHMARQTNMAVKMEAIHVPSKPRPLIQFSKPDLVEHCKVMTDRGLGGKSEAQLTFHKGNAPPTDLTITERAISNATQSETALVDADAEPPHVMFTGSISTELSPNRPDVQRTGFAGMRTNDMGYMLFGRVLWDLTPYKGIALRVKSDGRKYFVNLQADGLVPTDLHQCLLPALTPGRWETVIIPFRAFVRTNYGLPVNPQNEINKAAIKSVGISLTDRIQGPFELGIAEAYATNMAGHQLRKSDSGFEIVEEEEEEEGSFTTDPAPKRKPGEPEQIMI